MTEVEFLRRELERQLKAVDDLNKMVKDLSQITFESKMDKWLKASKGKEWVGLTDEDLENIKLLTFEKEINSDGEEQEAVDLDHLMRATEQLCKEKNT